MKHLLCNSELFKRPLLWTTIKQNPMPWALHSFIIHCMVVSKKALHGRNTVKSILTQFKRRYHDHMWAGAPLKAVGIVTHPLCYNSISMTLNLTGSTQNISLIEVRSLLSLVRNQGHCLNPQQPASVDVCHQHFIPSCCASLQSAGVCLIEINDNLGWASKIIIWGNLSAAPPHSVWNSLKTYGICSATSSGIQRWEHFGE